MTEWNVRGERSHWNMMCAVYSILLWYVWQVHIFHSHIALSVIRFWTVWASCLSSVYFIVWCCWMLMLVVRSLARSVGCTVVVPIDVANIADFQLINDCHTLDTSTVWQLLHFFCFDCLHPSHSNFFTIAARAPYFPISMWVESSCHRNSKPSIFASSCYGCAYNFCSVNCLSLFQNEQTSAYQLLQY